jgi:hypothetical protein
MNISDKTYSYLINIFGYSLIAVPIMAIYYNMSYALYYSYGTYSTLLVLSLLYILGAIRCSTQTAVYMVFEYRASRNFVSYIPVILMLSISAYALFFNHIILSSIIAAPIIINGFGRMIIHYKHYKAKNHA